MSSTTCACGNVLIWFSEQVDGECDTCRRVRWAAIAKRLAQEAIERAKEKQKQARKEGEGKA